MLKYGCASLRHQHHLPIITSDPLEVWGGVCLSSRANEQTWCSVGEIKDISSSREVLLEKKVHYIRLLIRPELRLCISTSKYLSWDLWVFVCIQTHFWKTHSCAMNQAFGISKRIKSHNLIYDLIGFILASISWHIILVCSSFLDGPYKQKHMSVFPFSLTTRYEDEDERRAWEI